MAVGRPSRAAVDEVSARLGAPSRDLVVAGDDVGMQITLGHLGGSRTILVRSGMGGSVDITNLSERERPDEVVDGVEELLPWL